MRHLSILLLLILLLVTAWFIQKDQTPDAPEVISEPPADLPPSEPTLGDEILVGYASPSSTGEQDLRLFHDYLTNVFILIKKRDTRDYATNEDLAQFLLGENAYKEPYLSPNSKILNADQQIIDRWGTPIRVHPVSTDLLELSSAGPDKKHFTEDDITWPQS